MWMDQSTATSRAEHNRHLRESVGEVCRSSQARPSSARKERFLSFQVSNRARDTCRRSFRTLRDPRPAGTQARTAWEPMTGLAIPCHPAYPFIMDTDDRSSTSMNVSLPKTLRSFVDGRVSSSSYTSASEYIRELIRKDREHRAAHDRLEELLLEGLASGPASEWTEGDWTSIRERVTKRLEAKKSSQ